MKRARLQPILPLPLVELEQKPATEPPAPPGPAVLPTFAAPALAQNDAVTALADRPLHFREVAELPMWLLADMPAAFSLVLRRPSGQLVVITKAREVYAAARARALPVFVGTEIFWMARAAEHDRAWPKQFETWCARKAEEPNWQLEHAAAMGAFRDEAPPLDWSTLRVLERLDLELISVTLGADLPPELGGAVASPNAGEAA